MWGCGRMAIYSCNLKSIGRTTHAAGTGGAHIRYISRPDAQPEILSGHMPCDPAEARNWIDRAERASRKNARVLDKIRIALPRELDEVQRAALVEEYMTDLAGGRRVPWYAAIHQTGKDAHNPHVHIAVHDRDMETGKRVLRLSDSARDRRKDGLPGPRAVDWIRERWEIVCNHALEQAGHDVRVDRRTLDAQGIDREPTIHVGPRASHIDGNVRRPESRRRVNGCGRVIDYPRIDKGKTRREFNAHIIDLNLERAARSDNPVTSVWAAFEKDQIAKDRALEDRLAGEHRERTAERRNAANVYNAKAGRIRVESKLKQRRAVQAIRDRFEPAREKLQSRQRRERQALNNRQGRLYVRLLTAIDLTGTTRRKQESARKALSVIHRERRHDLAVRYRQAKEAGLNLVRGHYGKQLVAVRTERSRHLEQLRERHLEAERLADLERQNREADREQASQVTERKIQEWQKLDKPALDKQVLAPPRQTAIHAKIHDDALARAFSKASEQNRPGQTAGRSRTRGSS